MTKKLPLLMITTLAAVFAAIELPCSLLFFAAYICSLLIVIGVDFIISLIFKRRHINEENNETKSSKLKSFFVTALILAFISFSTPAIYSEFFLSADDYTKAGDISKIIAVNNDSDYEVLRTVRNKKGEDIQVVVAKDLSEFTALVKASYNGSMSTFKLSDGRICHMTHKCKYTAFFGKFYNYNIFTFQGCTIQELLADDNRSC